MDMQNVERREKISGENYLAEDIARRNEQDRESRRNQQGVSTAEHTLCYL